MLRSRPGPQATETMGSGTGKGRVTPFLTCPRSSRAPDRIISPSRRTRRKPRASAQFRDSGITGGPPPLPQVPWPRALQGPWGTTPWRRPSPRRLKLVGLAGHSARDLGCARTARPALRRVSGTPKRAANCPLPHRRDGVRPPTCRPWPSRVRPPGSRAEGSGTSWSKAGKGTRADPLPLCRNGRGRGPAAPSSELPPLATLSAERKLPPPPAGLTWGRGRGFALGPQPSTPLPPGSKSCALDKVPRPEPGARKAAVAVLGGVGGRRGLHLSARESGKEGIVHISTRSLPP